MKIKRNDILYTGLLVAVFFHVAVAELDRETILQQLNLDPGGKTEVVKRFPKSFP